jgi:hypothetical protein
VLDRARGPVHDHQPGLVAPVEGGLGDEFGGEVEVEGGGEEGHVSGI